MIDTPQLDSVSDDDFSNNDATINQVVPLRRKGKPDEAAALISFLLSGDSAYVTGSTYHIDGGFYI